LSRLKFSRKFAERAVAREVAEEEAAAWEDPVGTVEYYQGGIPC
jgi:hypothetical protein